MIFDPKFTTSAKNFKKKILDNDLKYYRQAAYYIDLVKKLCGLEPDFFFIAIENAEPYGVDFFRLKPELIDYGRYENEMSIEKYLTWKKRQEENEIERIFPSWEEIIEVEKPAWLGKN